MAQLAWKNAEDILKLQPEGPYLIGGHSYGGGVAVEIAGLLEKWGHEVAHVIVWDSPLPAQIRPIQPDADDVSIEECEEMLGMTVGALGAETLGLGGGLQNASDTDAWRSMSFDEKLEFFAPIWRAMRSQDMPIEEVRRQLAFVTLSIKQGSQVSDTRRHEYTRPVIDAPILFFRAATRGACVYFSVRRAMNHIIFLKNNSLSSENMKVMSRANHAVTPYYSKLLTLFKQIINFNEFRHHRTLGRAIFPTESPSSASPPRWRLSTSRATTSRSCARCHKI